MATITFLFLVDRFGRRPLLFVGSAMCAFSMYYVAAYSSITNSFNTSQDQNAASNSAAAFIYIFGAGYVSYPVVYTIYSRYTNITPVPRLEPPLDHRSRNLPNSRPLFLHGHDDMFSLVGRVLHLVRRDLYVCQHNLRDIPLLWINDGSWRIVYVPSGARDQWCAAGRHGYSV